MLLEYQEPRQKARAISLRGQGSYCQIWQRVWSCWLWSQPLHGRRANIWCLQVVFWPLYICAKSPTFLHTKNSNNPQNRDYLHALDYPRDKTEILTVVNTKSDLPWPLADSPLLISPLVPPYTYSTSSPSSTTMVYLSLISQTHSYIQILMLSAATYKNCSLYFSKTILIIYAPTEVFSKRLCLASCLLHISPY